MFWIIKKIILLGVIALVLYAIFAEDGVKNIKKYANDIKNYVMQKEEPKDQSVREKEAIESDTWSNADRNVPEEFDSGDRPESKLKTNLKKLKNQVGGGDYGYK